MAVTTTNLGVITAYGDAVAAGYTGTKAEWQALMASYATVGQQAVDAKNAAVAAKDTAVAKATEATTAASTATTKANEASASAQSIAQSAAQIQENTDSIDQLKSELTDVEDAAFESVHRNDVLTGLIWNDGYHANGQVIPSNDYVYTIINNLRVGDICRVYRGAQQAIRFVEYYNGETYVKTETYVNDAVVPEGINRLIITTSKVFITYTDFSVTHEYTRQVAKTDIITNLIANKKPNRFEYTFNVASGGEYVTEQNFEEMCDFRICFTAKASRFAGVTKIGKGLGINYGGGIGFDGTNLYVYYDTSTTPGRTQPHGLTLKDYVSISFDIPISTQAQVTIRTNGGEYTWTLPYFRSRIGHLSVQSEDAITNCTLSYTFGGLTKETWIYGDSYLSIEDAKRWSTYLKQTGHTNYMLNGYPGRASTAALNSLKTELALGRYPKRIIWCMGMNNKDSADAPNSTWLSVVEELMEICENKHIELILTTIPNVPSTATKNDMKNAYVRASGYRYIDFANAISADGSSTWYDGMLSSDNVHPDTQGALALYSCAVAEVPELLL